MTRPDDIPDHVVDAYLSGAWPSDDYRAGIAAALDALMDDKPVMVPDWVDTFGPLSSVRPSDFLAAVLRRQS